MDVFKLDRLIIPINICDAHWAVACVNVRRLRIELYDSYRTYWKPGGVSKVHRLSPNARPHLLIHFFQVLLDFLDQHWAYLHQGNPEMEELNIADWNEDLFIRNVSTPA